jgi:uncharacterized protein
VIVFHVAIATAADYLARREPHRRAHLDRLHGLRTAGILIGGGPAPDGRGADLFYRLQEPRQIKNAIEEDPYFVAGAWTGYTPRSFAQFVEPWEMVPLVVDGSRVTTIVEGPVGNHDMAQFALIELRGAGRLVFGGFFEDGHTLAVLKTPKPDEAAEWLAGSGFWTRETLTARPWLYVL